MKIYNLLYNINFSYIIMAQKKRASTFCKLHNSKAIQLGSCLTCTSASTICQTKGCIKHHTQNQRVHNVHTIDYIRNVVDQYVNSDQSKRAYLKKMVHDYFNLAKKQMQTLFNQIYEAIDNFKFDSIILHQQQKKIAQLLIQEKYSEISCSDIATVIPKLIKCANFEDGHFAHLRNYLRTEKQKLPTLLNSMILNLPYFRQYDKNSILSKFCEIADDDLREVNRKLATLNYRPKKIRIKYSKHLFEFSRRKAIIQKQDQNDDDNSKIIFKRQGQFIKLLSSIENLNDAETIQIYCTWDIDHEQFQIACFEALTRLPFLNTITVFTGYRVTSIEYIEDIFEDKNIQVRIYRKEWHF